MRSLLVVYVPVLYAYTTVMLSPRSQNFGLGLKDLASVSKLWPRPRPQTFGLRLASISLSNYVIGRAFFGQKSCKIREFC